MLSQKTEIEPHSSVSPNQSAVVPQVIPRKTSQNFADPGFSTRNRVGDSHSRSRNQRSSNEVPVFGQRKRKYQTRAYPATGVLLTPETERQLLTTSPHLRTQSESRVNSRASNPKLGRKSSISSATSAAVVATSAAATTTANVRSISGLRQEQDHQQQLQEEAIKRSRSASSSSRQQGDEENNSRRTHSRESKSSSATSLDPTQLSEYKREFRWFHTTPVIRTFRPGSASRSSTPGGNNIPIGNMMMTRSATTEALKFDMMRGSSPEPQALLSPSGSQAARNTEYHTKFAGFDDYVYVDDVKGFRRKADADASVVDPTTSDDGSDVLRCSGGTGSSWIDQVRERHGQANLFAKRHYAGHPITGFESLSKMYEELQFPYPKNRELNALALATTRLVIQEKKREKSPRSRSVMSGSTKSSSRKSPAPSGSERMRNKRRSPPVGLKTPSRSPSAVRTPPATATTTATTTTVRQSRKTSPVAAPAADRTSIKSKEDAGEKISTSTADQLRRKSSNTASAAVATSKAKTTPAKGSGE